MTVWATVDWLVTVRHNASMVMDDIMNEARKSYILVQTVLRFLSQLLWAKQVELQRGLRAGQQQGGGSLVPVRLCWWGLTTATIRSCDASVYLRFLLRRNGWQYRSQKHKAAQNLRQTVTPPHNISWLDCHLLCINSVRVSVVVTHAGHFGRR